MSHNTSNQAGNRSTMERIAARIPGTTEHAERQHPGLTRTARGNVNTTQAAAVPPQAAAMPAQAAAVPPNVNQGVPQQQYGANTGPTLAAGQPGLNKPRTGQKITGKTKAGMGRLLGNPQKEAEGIQQASGGAYAPAGGNMATQQSAYPPAAHQGNF